MSINENNIQDNDEKNQQREWRVRTWIKVLVVSICRSLYNDVGKDGRWIRVLLKNYLFEMGSSHKLTTSIVEVIVTNLSSKMAEKFTQYDNKIASLDAETNKLKETLNVCSCDTFKND